MLKKRLFVLLAAWAVFLTACSGLAMSDPAPAVGGSLPEPLEAKVFVKPEYEILPFTSGSQIRAEDETVVAHCSYQVILLGLQNEEDVSPEAAEAAARNVAVFNEKMRTVHTELAEQGTVFGEDAVAAYEEFGSLAAEYEDDADIGADFCGDIVSAVLHRSSYTGGAHPNRYAASYLFDLTAGQFIDPTQVADDPEAFRTGASELLLEKAAAHRDQEAFWQDYASILSRWNEGTVRFDSEGMWVIYSPYELGPYAIGDVELVLSWEELEPLIGPGGMAKLGRGITE